MTYLYVALGIGVLISIFALIQLWVIRHSNKIYSYFIFATVAYAIGGKTDARQAAIASASVINVAMYPMVLEMMSCLGIYLSNVYDESHEIMDQRVSEIFLKIKKNSNANIAYTKSEMFENKLMLSKMNRKYFNALNNPNPKVFADDYQSIEKIYDELQKTIDETRKEFIFGKK